jgi:1-pyrroline-5-carboxylate dehydrogenase
LASRAHHATLEEVRLAVGAARQASAGWRQTPFEERCAHLRSLALVLERRHVETAALISLESGKVRSESLAEVQEAIDLIEIYCGQVERANGFDLPLESLTPEEHNFDTLRPYGVFAVISPFNFPLALAVNMTSAALLAGNTVVFKPSEAAPRTGDALARAAVEAELPRGVLNLVQGGPQTGAMLVEDQIDGVAFTGSAEVGRAISGKLSEGPYPRPVLAEMGGKNPAIVTARADIEKAAEGVARAAFGLSGQKCSSCSRAIVLDAVHGSFVECLVSTAASLAVGDPSDRRVELGPVVDAEAVERFRASVATAGRDGELVAGGGTREGGYFVEPTIVEGLPPGHELNRRELFLPLLTVISVSDLDDAIAEANAVDYGLTAGIFSEDEHEVGRFLDEMQAGILYVNRRAGATTGAWPGVQSFCGWKASGLTGKGGLGPYYVQQFAREQSRTIVG